MMYICSACGQKSLDCLGKNHSHCAGFIFKENIELPYLRVMAALYCDSFMMTAEGKFFEARNYRAIAGEFITIEEMTRRQEANEAFAYKKLTELNEKNDNCMIIVDPIFNEDGKLERDEHGNPIVDFINIHNELMAWNPVAQSWFVNQDQMDSDDDDALDGEVPLSQDCEGDERAA